MRKTIFITGGGTGGHIYPAVAVYKAFLDEDVNLFYIGNKKKMEFEIAKTNNFNFLSVDVDGLPTKLFPFIFVWGLKLFFAIIKMIFYFIKYKPNVVFGTGGYVSAPALFASSILNVPYMLHDSDSVPGKVSKLFSKNAKKISVAFLNAKKYLKNENIYVNGNPIRKEFSTISKVDAKKILNIDENKTVVLFAGGSQGAKSINNAVLGMVERLNDKKDVVFIVQTGKKNYDDFIEKAGKLPDNFIVKPYFDKMFIPLIASDLVISRSGSLSLSEITASKAASILIPFPFATQNHQMVNAKKMADASIIIEDKNLTSEILFDTISDLLDNRYKLNEMKSNAEKLAKPYATIEIKGQILEILNAK